MTKQLGQRASQALSVIAALSLAGSAAAQPSKPREGTLGGGGASAGGAALNREQLRQCLVEQDALKGQHDALARDQQQGDAEKSELARAGAALTQEFEAIDKNNADALQAHIARTKEHDQRVEAYNAKLPEFNTRVKSLNQRSADWKSNCAGRTYREDDLILLQARKQVPGSPR